MFFTVFSAVLLALLVYRFLTKATTEQKEGILVLVRWIFIIGLFLAIIIGLVSLIYFHRDGISSILIFLFWCAIISLPFVLGIIISDWRKFKQRRKLGLIKEGIKRGTFSQEYERKRYESLTKQQKEIEDKRSRGNSKIVLWLLITIPLLLLTCSIVLLVRTLLDTYH